MLDKGYIPIGSGINSIPPNEECEHNDGILGNDD